MIDGIAKGSFPIIDSGIYYLGQDIVEANQWFENGDHPDDGDHTFEGNVVRYFRHPSEELRGTKRCPHCETTYHNHGWLDTSNPVEVGHFTKDIVCPGDIIYEANSSHYVVSPEQFKKLAIWDADWEDHIEIMQEKYRKYKATLSDIDYEKK